MIVARVVSKGAFFSIGLSSVITAVDPGFEGQLGITVANLSNRGIKLKQGDTIAKIEFEKLGKPVAKPYKGPHSFATDLWPTPTEKVVSARKITAEMVRDEKLLAAEASRFGEPLDLIASRIMCSDRRLSSDNLLVRISLSLSSALVIVLLYQQIAPFVGFSPSNIVTALIILGPFLAVLFQEAISWLRKKRQSLVDTRSE